MRIWHTQISILLCFAVIAECGAATLSLADWLNAANRQGIRIIYSSALVRPAFKVTDDAAQPASLDQIRQVLQKFDLDLKAAGANTWVVTRRNLDPVEVEAIPRPINELPRRDMEEIVVTSSKYRLMIDQSPSHSVLDHDEIANRPAIANDAMRVVNQLPGNAGVGISVKPRIRGGKQDETLFLFNGVRLYEPFHFSAFNNLFSTIDGRIIESLDVYSGGFPARFGDRLSGVVSITSESPASLGEIREAGAGLYNFSYLQAGQGAGGRYMVDLRRSSFELWQGVSESDLGRPMFSDLYVRHDYELGGGARLSTNLLWYGDKISLNNSSDTESARVRYSNTYLWWNLEQEFGTDGYSNTRLTVADIHTNRRGNVSIPSLVSGQLAEEREFQIYSLTQDFSKRISNSWWVESGLDWRYLDGNYESRQALNVAPAFADISNFNRPTANQDSADESGQQLGLYGRFKWTIGSHIVADAGVRLDAQDYIDGWTCQVSPRINLLYEVGPATELRLGWGKFAQAQGPHELDLTDGVTDFQRPEKAIHQIISLTHRLPAAYIRLELYRKRGTDNGYYFENLTNPLTLVPELQVDRIIVDPEDFDARGAELSISGQQETISWWINYTWSYTRDTVDGMKIERSWDQTRSANAGISFGLGAWTASLTGQYHTGWPTTPLFLADSANVVAGKRNSVRFGHYLSWDLKLKRQWPVGNQQSIRLEAGITNLSNRENQIGIEYTLDQQGTLIAEEQFALGMAPFLDLYWRF